MRIAVVCHGKDGYLLRVEDIPAWAYLLDAINEGLIGRWCKLTRGWGCPLCLCSNNEWTFSVGWGRDEDGLRRHSLGGFLFALGQRGGRFRLGRSPLLYERLLTFDEVCEHFPGDRTEWDDDGEMCVRGVLVATSADSFTWTATNSNPVQVTFTTGEFGQLN